MPAPTHKQRDGIFATKLHPQLIRSDIVADRNYQFSSRWQEAATDFWLVIWKDYYEILGVDRKATDDQIKKAYRRLARRWCSIC